MNESHTRLWIAIAMVSLSAVGVIVISWVAIATATDTERSDTARLVFSSILPLLGTWVGTILAFYFARENLEAATVSTVRLAGRLAPTTPVREVMIPRAKITAHTVATEADAQNVKLADLQTKMGAEGHHRMPVFFGSDSVIYVIHDSTIAKFAELNGIRVADLADETTSDLVALTDLGKQVTALGFVGPDANIAEARAAMRSVSGCNDVFVTEQGQRRNAVVGWLTNTDLASVE
jgi:hypothetical protein